MQVFSAICMFLTQTPLLSNFLISPHLVPDNIHGKLSWQQDIVRLRLFLGRHYSLCTSFLIIVPVEGAVLLFSCSLLHMEDSLYQ